MYTCVTHKSTFSDFQQSIVIIPWTWPIFMVTFVYTPKNGVRVLDYDTNIISQQIYFKHNVKKENSRKGGADILSFRSLTETLCLK